MEYRDIHEFKRCYKYLVEEKGRTQKSILDETQLHAPLVNSLIRSKNGDKVKINASTLAKIQDFNLKYRDDIFTAKSIGISQQEIGELAEDLEEEGYLGRKKPPTVTEEKEAKLKTLDECDVFDLLKAISFKKNVKIIIEIKES